MVLVYWEVETVLLCQRQHTPSPSSGPGEWRRRNHGMFPAAKQGWATPAAVTAHQTPKISSMSRPGEYPGGANAKLPIPCQVSTGADRRGLHPGPTEDAVHP